MCGRRMTLKSGSLHVADGGGPQSSSSWCRGHGLLLLYLALLWLAAYVHLMSRFLEWQYMGLIVRIYVVPGSVASICVTESWQWGSCGPVSRRTQKKNSGTPNARLRGNKDRKSPTQICRPEFSSSSMVRGQVAGWGVGRERRWKPWFFLEGKVLLI